MSSTAAVDRLSTMEPKEANGGQVNGTEQEGDRCVVFSS
jgi:hypothetical protein